MFKSIGTLRYTHQHFNLVLDCDPGLGKYYRWMLSHSKWHWRIIIRRPSWKEHITVIRGPYEWMGPEDTNSAALWGKYEGNSIEFEYEPVIRTREPEPDRPKYFWLSISSPQLLDIREELGLPREPPYPLHLTIGNLWE